ncbi:MAG: DUF2784 domain-containing protein [Gammaproteobacteria bacterium]
MDAALAARIAADLVLAAHAGIVVFVVAGLAGVLVGGWRGWAWVRYRAFRYLHLAAIGVVVAQSWLGIVCPLTTLEQALRARAGDATYSGAFIAHWLERLLFYAAPWWVFTAAYSGFAVLVLLAWWWVPPRPRDHGAA